MFSSSPFYVDPNLNMEAKHCEEIILTGLLFLVHFARFMPQGPAVFLQLVETVLLPRVRSDLDQLSANQQELQIWISIQTWSDKKGHLQRLTASISNLLGLKETINIFLIQTVSKIWYFVRHLLAFLCFFRHSEVKTYFFISSIWLRACKMTKTIVRIWSQ